MPNRRAAGTRLDIVDRLATITVVFLLFIYALVIIACLKLRGKDEHERTYRANTPLLILGIVGVAGFLGLIIIAITMFFASRQGNDIGDTGRKLGMWAGGITLVGAAGAIVSALL